MCHIWLMWDIVSILQWNSGKIYSGYRKFTCLKCPQQRKIWSNLIASRASNIIPFFYYFAWIIMYFSTIKCPSTSSNMFEQILTPSQGSTCFLINPQRKPKKLRKRCPKSDTKVRLALSSWNDVVKDPVFI